MWGEGDSPNGVSVYSAAIRELARLISQLPNLSPIMLSWQRRVARAVAVVAGVVFVYATLYRWAMGVWEGEAVSAVQAVQVVIEAITTAGFGGHAPWSHPVLNTLVLIMNLTGVVLFFLAVPAFVVPLLQEALTTEPPTTVDLEGHVIICTHTPRGAALAEALEQRGVPYVFVEPHRARAAELHESGVPVLVGNPESTAILKQAGLDRARGLVADAADDVNASIALSVRELDADVRVITLVEDPALERYHRLAGADAVLSPRQLVGASLARHVPTVTSTQVDVLADLGPHVELFELTVEAGSALSGTRLQDARLRERYGLDVLGALHQGTFTSPCPPDTPLPPGIRLLVAGRPDRVDTLQNALGQTPDASLRRFVQHRVVIAGYGRAGQAAAEVLAGTPAQITVLDRDAQPAVDVVGDVRDPSALRKAHAQEATAVLIAVNDDTTAIFATLVLRELHPEVYIIVRAEKEEDVPKLYRAGADYVQSLATVSGRMMEYTLLDEAPAAGLITHIELAKRPVGGLAGQTLDAARVRTRTGATVLAVYRDDTVHTTPNPTEFSFAPDDTLLLAGTPGAIERFAETFGADGS